MLNKIFERLAGILLPFVVSEVEKWFAEHLAQRAALSAASDETKLSSWPPLSPEDVPPQLSDSEVAALMELYGHKMPMTSPVSSVAFSKEV